jgi:hypothetical protein
MRQRSETGEADQQQDDPEPPFDIVEASSRSSCGHLYASTVLRFQAPSASRRHAQAGR